jgi:putative heme-binding domain-containing protein
LAAVERGEIDRAAIPRETLQDLSLHKNREVTAAVTKLFADAAPISREELRNEIARLQSLIAHQPGIPKNGRELFAKHCARCHTLFGAGGRVGPELTTYPRHDGQALLTHIVDPSAEIREGYGTTAISMTDGRQISGVMVDSDQRVVVLRTSDGSELTIAREEIDELQPVKMSLMPEGMLKTLSEQEIRDLLAYLRSSQPVIDK